MVGVTETILRRNKLTSRRSLSWRNIFLSREPWVKVVVLAAYLEMFFDTLLH